MLNFISRVFANLVSLAIFFVVIPALVLLAVAVGLIVGFSGDQGQKMITPKDGVLVYDMSRGVSEFKNPQEGLSRLFNPSRGMSTYDLCMRLATAAKNKNIKAVLIYGSFDSASDYPSSAQVAELRNALLQYRQGGGKVTAYLENPSQLDYYLASCADTIIMNPFGEFTLRGMALQMPFVGDAMKKYGVDVQVIKAGAHKSFGEMFTSAKMSDFDRTRMRDVIDSLWTNILAEISASRKISMETLSRIVDADAVFSARRAKELKLVDSLMYYDEVVEKMRKDYGEDGESFPQIPVARLSEVRAPSADEIAVVYMRSEIVESGKVSEFTSSEVYVPLLRSLRTDDLVKAVVLRIDSGGGSAYASEAIRREVELLAKKKPVIASFGGVAASGAYWIATAANKIIATPQTITGSIGVFSIAFSGRKFASDWGVTFDGVKTSKFSDIGTLTRPMTGPEIAKMKLMVDDIYDAFVERVSKSRKLGVQETRELADGSVYSGVAALRLKLVDELGDLGSAINAGAMAAKLKMGNYNIGQYPRTDAVRELLADLSGDEGDYFARFFIPKSAKAYAEAAKTFAKFGDRRRIYARIPFDFVWEK